MDNTAASRLLDQMGITKRIYSDQVGPYRDLGQNQIDAVLLDLPIALYFGMKIGQISFFGMSSPVERPSRQASRAGVPAKVPSTIPSICTKASRMRRADRGHTVFRSARRERPGRDQVRARLRGLRLPARPPPVQGARPTVTAARRHPRPRFRCPRWSASPCGSASTSSTSLPISVSKMTFAGG